VIQLTVLLGGMCIIFGYIGFLRGWNKEVIATSGIILGLFALFEFDEVLDALLTNLPADQGYAVRAVIFIVIVYFSYQTRAIIGPEATRSRGGSRDDGRDRLQASVLGSIVGAVNGYLIWGTLWYFMHVTSYPLQPYISAPPEGSPSANFVDSLPLFVLGGGPGGDGNLLAAAVIGLFLIVLIVI
jgi:uncharacterized membrane protein required for colicin V production